MGVRVERLRRRRARRTAVRLSVAASLLGVALILAPLRAPADAPLGASEGVRYLASGGTAPAWEAESPVPIEGWGAGLPSADPYLSGTLVGKALDVGVWVAKGVTRRLVNLLNAPTEDPSSVVGPVWLTPRTVVFASVVVKGKSHDVLTNAATVEELLSAMGIEPDWNDRVSSPLQTPIQSGDLVRFMDVEVRTERLLATIPYPTEVTYTDDLAPGVRQVLRAGAPGRALQVWRIRVVNGRVVERRLVEARILLYPVEARVRVGRDAPGAVQGTQVGEASWYHAPSHALTAAHPWLPFGTVVTVTNLANGKSVTVVINDRGPFGGRIIDLSAEAFARIAPLSQGVCQVRLTW